jgi:hypothetical protein
VRRVRGPETVLDQIDKYLVSKTTPLEEKRALWDILAGIRGPDKKKERKTLKREVTGVIRAHAFPRFAASLGSATGDKRPDFRPTIQLGDSLRLAAGKIPESGTGHYHTHAWRALMALAHARGVRRGSAGGTQ